MAQKESRLTQRVVMGLMTSFFLAFMLLLAIVSFGRVEGDEFDPDTFQRRTFVYYQLPWAHVQVYPIDRRFSTCPLATKLMGDKLVPPVKSSSKPRWHLVRAQVGNGDPQRADAAMLCDYLDALDADGSSAWSSWSDNYPEQAKVLWPVVAQLARKNQYVLIPAVMKLGAQGASQSAEWLQTRIAQHLAAEYTALADTQRQLEQMQVARELYQEALAQVDDYAPAAEALRELGPSETSSTQLESADESQQP